MLTSAAIPNQDVLAVDVTCEAAPRAVSRRAVGWIGATVLVVTLLFCIPGRGAIAPVIEADNAYIYLAADRLYDGLGAMSIPPRAPLQPWTWRADWVFLTQWPVGYPALVCATRWLTGLSTARAGVALGVVCCGVALVAWFAWVSACLPKSAPALLVALVAAGATFSMRNLVNPASDTVLLALLPIVLLLMRWALRWRAMRDATCCAEYRPVLARVAVVGLAAGALVWLRYAAIFVPAALGGFLLCEWSVARRVRARDVLAFGVGAMSAVIALVMVNRTLGANVSTQEQFNLGSAVSWQIDWSVFVTAWRNFTQQTPYAYRPEAAVFYAAVLPLGLLGITLFWPTTRRAVRGLLASPPMLLSVYVTCSLLGMLVVASVLFAGKYNYVGLDRYYQPVRPLYFLIFLAPLALIPWRSARLASCVPLVLVCMWFVNQDARRAQARMLAKSADVTDYGRNAQHFRPNAKALFAWLTEQRGDGLVVFSNFHEEIALETGIPACPTPRDRDELETWLARIREARGVNDLDVLFVLNPDNEYRDYYLDPPSEIVTRFALEPATDQSPGAPGYTYRWDGDTSDPTQ